MSACPAPRLLSPPSNNCYLKNSVTRKKSIRLIFFVLLTPLSPRPLQLSILSPTTPPILPSSFHCHLLHSLPNSTFASSFTPSLTPSSLFLHSLPSPTYSHPISFSLTSSLPHHPPLHLSSAATMGCSESKDLQQISVSNAHKKLESSLEGLEVVRMTSSATSSGQGSSVPHTPEEKDQQRARENHSNIPTSLDNIPTNDLGVSKSLVSCHIA